MNGWMDILDERKKRKGKREKNSTYDPQSPQNNLLINFPFPFSMLIYSFGFPDVMVISCRGVGRLTENLILRKYNNILDKLGF